MRRKQLLTCLGLGVIAPFISFGVAHADPGQEESQLKAKPFSIARQGSFFVNERNDTTKYPAGVGTPVPGKISVEGMYVEYQIPENKKYNYPVIMIHGAAHTAKTWDETPDGRDGWKTYFLRRGFSVYVVDAVGRGRSGFDPTSINKAKLESKPDILPSLFKFTNESTWTAFRLGSTPYEPFPGTQFPVDSFKEYVAQMLPNTEVTVDTDCQTAGANCNLTIEAVSALMKKIGPSIVMGHSQGGTISMGIANASPSLVKAVIPVEPASGCIIPDENLSNFKDISFYAIFGDYTAEYPNWVDWSNGCKQSAKKIRRVGGAAQTVMLPDIGITGNTHMLMLEKNNIEIADKIIDWIDKKVPGARAN